MPLNKDFLMGFVSGTVFGAVGYRVYEQNYGQLKNLVQNNVPTLSFQAPRNELTIEELVSQKERLEDLSRRRMQPHQDNHSILKEQPLMVALFMACIEKYSC
ncbi:hypothetical protein [Bacillus sp. T33-2]|uniref:hypothetical protein n=1 Tax=Bacillus sp. T33-2 TaxID=2054168 RepID=UPI0021552B39|nr:hypothetical protein [Bacillus sp. T33-2]